MALETTDADQLLALYRGVVTELRTLQAQFNQNGSLPAFSVDGVSVDWPGYRDHLIRMKDAYWKEWIMVTRMNDGPVVLRTIGQ